MKNKFYNPPPNNLVPATAKGAITPSVVIGKITLKNTDPDIEAAAKGAKNKSSTKDTVVSISPSIQQGTAKKPYKPWYDDRNKVDLIRVRIILCTNPDYAKDVMDYMAQRYNEYQSLQASSQDVKKVNKFLDSVAKQTNSKIIGSAYPGGPLDTDFLTKRVKDGKNNVVSYSAPGMKGVFVYDNSLTNLIKKGANGKTLLENKQSKVFSTSRNGKSVELANIEIPMGTVEFNIGTLAKEDQLDQLSCYAFTYYDSEVFLEQNNLQKPNGYKITTPLQTGMGFVTSKTALGSKKVYPSQTLENSLVGNLDFQVEENPDNGIFVDTRGVGYLKRMEIFDLLSENFYDSMILDGKGNNNFTNISQEMASEIKYKNYFSNLWLSRDKQENIRYMFSFDKQSFLRESSMYSQLYLNDEVAQLLMSGGDGLAKQDASRVLDIKLVRRRVHRDKITTSNSLGTMVKRKPLENTEREQEKIVGNPEIENISVGNKGVVFYSGFDSYEEEMKRQSSGIYQYGVTFYLQDSAPIYLMKISEGLQERIRNLSTVSDYILNVGGTSLNNLKTNIGGGILYNPQTNTRQQSLRNISLLGRTASDLVSEAIKFYVKSISIFVPALSDTDKLTEDLTKFINEPEMENFFKVIDIIAEFRQKLEQIIEVQFPKGYHDDRSTEPDMLKRRGFCQRKYNILQVTHYFDELHDVGESYKTGYSFLSPADGDSLGVLTTEGLRLRASEEFKKYFSLTDGSQMTGEEMLGDLYREGSYSYFSPETIYVNGRQTINQTNFISTNSNQTEYDMDSYASLLMDLVVLKNNKNRLLQITDQGNAVSANNKLFENLTHALTGKDCLISGDDLSISDFFPVPKPKRKSNSPTAKKEPQKKLKKTSSISVLPYLLGGMKDDSPSTAAFYNEQRDVLLDKNFEDDLNKDPSDVIEGLRESNQPVKLAFSILGQMELTVPGIKEDAEKLNLTHENLKQTLTVDLSSIPNQIKSMLIVATSMTGQNFGSGLDAVRNLSLDLEDAHPQQSISTTSATQNFPPYQGTLDPMLVYSKMTAFWLNYRHLCVLEYLAGFEEGKSTRFISKYVNSVSPRNETFSTIRKKEVWKKITTASVEELTGKSILCRVRMANEKENISLTPDAAPSRQIQFSHKELFNLPLYDEYFILNA